MKQDTFDIVSQRIVNVHKALVRDGHSGEDVADAMFFNIVRAYVAGGTPPAELHAMLDMVINATKKDETEEAIEEALDGAQ